MTTAFMPIMYMSTIFSTKCAECLVLNNPFLKILNNIERECSIHLNYNLINDLS